MEFSSAVLELLQAHGQTDMAKLIGAFLQLLVVNPLKNYENPEDS
jgi:hypothetical protein